MPRSGRIPSESGFYHVTARGNGRQIIFEDDVDRRAFLDLLSKCKAKQSVEIIAWCLMDNHIHLLIEDRQGNMSKMMRALIGGYAVYFNKRHKHVGHVFQDRFGSSPVESDVYILESVQYIHNNPAKAGICLAEEYPWSSFSEYVCGGDIASTSMVLEMLGGIDQFILFSKDHTPKSAPSEGPRRRLLDHEAAVVAAGVLRTLGTDCRVSEVKELKKDIRDAALIGFRAEGLSVRQIQSLTGIGTTTVKKATSSVLR